MKKSNRIGLSLFDEELLGLINASAKIFPITQTDVDADANPNNYEYARVGNHIYRWSNNKWSYIIADDTDIDWSDIKNKPVAYVPKEHTHSELHNHSNKTLLDTITENMINLWNTVVDKATKIYVDGMLATKSDTTHTHDGVYSEANHTHPYASDTHNHDTNYYKKTEVDSKLLTKSDGTHNHDGAYYKKNEVDNKLVTKSDTTHKHTEADITDLDKYTKVEVDDKVNTKANVTHMHVEADISDLDKYTKAEIDGKLGGKSNTSHGHAELHTHVNKNILDKLIETSPEVSYDLSNLEYIEDIRNGYTEGHSHTNLLTLKGITDILVDGWNSAVAHVTDVIKHITPDERALWNTVSNKEDKFTKGTAFNKNFGTIAGTVTQGNDSRLSNARTPTAHDHDTLYYKKNEVDVILSGKSNTNHIHDYATIGHLHDDRYYTESEIDSKLSSKANSTTVSGHTSNSTVHVTSGDKTTWNGKANVSQIPTKLSELEIDIAVGGVSIGTIKPADGSMWYEVI